MVGFGGGAISRLLCPNSGVCWAPAPAPAAAATARAASGVTWTCSACLRFRRRCVAASSSSWAWAWAWTSWLEAAEAAWRVRLEPRAASIVKPSSRCVRDAVLLGHEALSGRDEASLLRAVT
ncbi:hypothetical protein MKX07_000160 [Trichoderma sp. CBMAI-0711]|nr:hypothetical protein MKX07_000160 [Trichoderma sp. CBMAI-0711]